MPLSRICRKVLKWLLRPDSMKKGVLNSSVEQIVLALLRESSSMPCGSLYLLMLMLT